jgi:preprotein translocase subunit SecG
MKIVVVVLNAVLFAFTCSILMVDGSPTETFYKLLTLFVLLVPLLSFLVILQSGMTDGWLGARIGTKPRVEPSSTLTLVRRVTVLLNAVLLANSCWAIVTQYPQHPKEEGLLAYAVVILLTPILNIVVLLQIMKRKTVVEHGSAA